MKKKENSNQYFTKKNILTIAVLLFVSIISIATLLYFKNNPLNNSDSDQVAKDSIINTLQTNPNVINSDQFLALNGESDTTYTDYILNNGGHYLPNIPLFSVGEETFTSDDVNLYFLINLQSSYYPQTQPTKEQLSLAIDEIINESIGVQSLQIEYPELESVLYTSSERDSTDYYKRLDRYTKAKEDFYKNHTKSVRGEFITIWSFNTFMPPMGPDKANEIARTTMDSIHTRLLENEITMYEAGIEISSDEVLATIDPSLVSNSYREFNSDDGFEIFGQDSFNTTLLTLEEGEISDVLVAYEDQEAKKKPIYYGVIKVNEISGDGVKLENLIEQNRSVYLLQTL